MQRFVLPFGSGGDTLTGMVKRVISFRCPPPLREAVDQMAREMKVTRSLVINTAIRMLNADVARRRGEVLPSIKGSVTIKRRPRTSPASTGCSNAPGEA